MPIMQQYSGTEKPIGDPSAKIDSARMVVLCRVPAVAGDSVLTERITWRRVLSRAHALPWPPARWTDAADRGAGPAERPVLMRQI